MLTTLRGSKNSQQFTDYRQLHLPVNARAKNMFSRDV